PGALLSAKMVRSWTNPVKGAKNGGDRSDAPRAVLNSHSTLHTRRGAPLDLTSNLEGEINSAADHSEVVPRAFDHAEAEIVHPANVAGDPCFEPRPKLSEQFGLAAVMDRESIGDESIRRGHK